MFNIVSAVICALFSLLLFSKALSDGNTVFVVLWALNLSGWAIIAYFASSRWYQAKKIERNLPLAVEEVHRQFSDIAVVKEGRYLGNPAVIVAVRGSVAEARKRIPGHVKDIPVIIRRNV